MRARKRGKTTTKERKTSNVDGESWTAENGGWENDGDGENIAPVHHTTASAHGPPRSHSVAEHHARLLFSYSSTVYRLVLALPSGTGRDIIAMYLAILAFFAALFVAQVVGQILGTRRRNVKQREKLLSELGVENAATKKIVGFFHPYW